MAPTFSYLCLSLLFLLLTPLSSSARTHYTKPCQSCDPANNSIQFLGHHAGYYRLPHTVDARMFYFFFESRKSSKSAPVVIWLTGGPGCSSELALFYENGPFHISNNLSLIWNDFGWDQESNLIFVDQPTGTGFSYSFSANDTHHNEESISNDLYDFLQLSLLGVDKGNKANEGIFINLKGFAIGNGLTNPAIQFDAYADFALYMKLINQSEYSNVTDLVPPCEQAIQACGNYRWVNLMQWSGQNNFTTAAADPFVVDGALGGIMKAYGSLTFLKAFNAGHMVPMDQPKAALEMLKRWTQGTLTVAGDQSNIPISDFGSLDF
ncbi:hypothetical protein ACSBR1_033686 [Camellia fascicularis]